MKMMLPDSPRASEEEFQAEAALLLNFNHPKLLRVSSENANAIEWD